MKPSRKTRRGQSVRAEEKRRPTIVEVVFPDPVEDESSEAPAKSAAEGGADAKNGSRRKDPSDPERIVFRF